MLASSSAAALPPLHLRDPQAAPKLFWIAQGCSDEQAYGTAFYLYKHVRRGIGRYSWAAQAGLMDCYLHGRGVNQDNVNAFILARSLVNDQDPEIFHEAQLDRSAYWMGAMRAGQMICFGQADFDIKDDLDGGWHPGLAVNGEKWLQAAAQQNVNKQAQLLARSYLAAYHAVMQPGIENIETDPVVLHAPYAPTEARFLAHYLDVVRRTARCIQPTDLAALIELKQRLDEIQLPPTAHVLRTYFSHKIVSGMGAVVSGMCAIHSMLHGAMTGSEEKELLKQQKFSLAKFNNTDKSDPEEIEKNTRELVQASQATVKALTKNEAQAKLWQQLKVYAHQAFFETDQLVDAMANQHVVPYVRSLGVGFQMGRAVVEHDAKAVLRILNNVLRNESNFTRINLSTHFIEEFAGNPAFLDPECADLLDDVLVRVAVLLSNEKEPEAKISSLLRLACACLAFEGMAIKNPFMRYVVIALDELLAAEGLAAYGKKYGNQLQAILPVLPPEISMHGAVGIVDVLTRLRDYCRGGNVVS